MQSYWLQKWERKARGKEWVALKTLGKKKEMGFPLEHPGKIPTLLIPWC